VINPPPAAPPAALRVEELYAPANPAAREVAPLAFPKKYPPPNATIAITNHTICTKYFFIVMFNLFFSTFYS
jgi:hypothetical protein